VTITGRLAAAWRSGPLSGRSFRLLACGQFTSTVGDYCYAVALPWLVLSTHGGAILLGTVLACYGLPRTVLIPVGGLLADKIGARTIMLAADAARCGLVVALVVLAAGHVASLALLGPVAALLGAGEGLFIPASFSVMPSLLEPEQLAAGNAINSAAVQAGGVAGPVLGGLLVAAAGPTPAFAVDAASFAVSALSLALVRLRPSPTAAPALAHARFGAGGYGALIACLGTGAVIGTLAAARGGNAGRPALVAAAAFWLRQWGAAPAARPGDERNHAGRSRQLPGVRGAGAPPRPVSVFPRGRGDRCHRRSRCNVPAGVPGFRVGGTARGRTRAPNPREARCPERGARRGYAALGSVR
jgi:MFS family permease